MSEHRVKVIPVFKCGECNSTMHREHDQDMLSCLRCDVIVKLDSAHFQDKVITAEVIRESPMLRRQII